MSVLEPAELIALRGDLNGAYRYAYESAQSTWLTGLSKKRDTTSQIEYFPIDLGTLKMRRWDGPRVFQSTGMAHFEVRTHPREVTRKAPLTELQDSQLANITEMARAIGVAVKLDPGDQALDLLQNGTAVAIAAAIAAGRPASDFTQYYSYDGLPFFDAAHMIGIDVPTSVPNLILTPASFSAGVVQSYEASRAVLADGRAINRGHTELVVAPQRESVAKQFLRSEFISDGTTSVSNPNRDLMTLVVDPQLAGEPDVVYTRNGNAQPLFYARRKPASLTVLDKATDANVFFENLVILGADNRAGIAAGLYCDMTRIEGVPNTL